MKKILVVEDDPAIRIALEAGLKEENYDVLLASDGLDGAKQAKNPSVDLILLDIMLPGKDGLEICSELRATGVNTLVMMLTSKAEEIDKVLGLEIGADDYMTKPFSMRELKARIKALLRRTQELKKGIEEASFGDLHFDFKKQEASKAKEPLKLSAKEFQIVKFFIEHEGEVLGRDKLLDEVWGYNVFPTTRTVDNYILSIRKKIENDPAEPKHLITVHTSGYKFVK
jgi:two-component system alkaline phosphatase synthesis response regulator PhoP